MKKLKFRKFAATDKFLKLFGIHQKDQESASANKPENNQYEFYYKRGNTYYFRNSDGNKVSINYNEPQELVRGNKYNLDAINHLDS